MMSKMDLADDRLGGLPNRLLASDPSAASGSELTNGGRQPGRHGLRRWLAVWVATALALVGVVGSPAHAGTDDYPYKDAVYVGVSEWSLNGRSWSDWGFYYRNCTDFVAHRMNNTNEVSFYNTMGGGKWGNANNWDDNARRLGYAVDNTPVRGAIAQTDAGSYGHVAWVDAVNSDGTVTIEEYNYAWTGTFNRRTVPASSFVYIHVKDLDSAPVSSPEGRPYFLSSLKSSGDAYAKSGMNGGWVWETSPVVQTAVASDPKNGMFYGALAPDGTLYGKQGLEGSWTKLTSDVRQFSVASDPVNGLFVAAVKTDGSVHGKQGMHGGWTRLTAGAKQVAISSDSRNGLFGLTVKPGVWKPSGVKVSYQWLRSGKAIKGATKPSYKLTSKDKRKKITVKVTGKKAGYTTKSVVSKATKKVG